MKFFTAITALAAAGAASAAAISERGWGSPIPGYPWGNGICLTDQQANFLVQQYMGLLTNPNRQQVNQTAQYLVTNNYFESSDSINILAGFPLGSNSFNGKQDFIANIVYAPPIGGMSTIEVSHNCNEITWRWLASALGEAIHQVKGINVFKVPSPLSGQISEDYLEFNSIAWGIDTGYHCQDPKGNQL